MQTVSDSLLGWCTLPDQPGGTPKDYYVRQLWDGKGSFDLSVFNPDQLDKFARAYAKQNDADCALFMQARERASYRGRRRVSIHVSTSSGV